MMFKILCDSWRHIALAAFVTLFTASSLPAVERTLRIEAPSEVAANAAIAVVVLAGTDAGQGERIGFLQVEASLDGGRIWAPMCYLDNIGSDTRQIINLKAGSVGTEIQVRARVAFRDGLAGDVDYTGAAIRWSATWGAWEAPPAKTVAIAVKGK